MQHQIIYTEKELKNYIKNLYNSKFSRSVKKVQLNLDDQFLQIEAKYRPNFSKIKARESYVEIFQNKTFIETLEYFLKYRYNVVNIKIEKRTQDIVLNIFYNE